MFSSVSVNAFVIIYTSRTCCGIEEDLQISCGGACLFYIYDECQISMISSKKKYGIKIMSFSLLVIRLGTGLTCHVSVVYLSNVKMFEL